MEVRAMSPQETSKWCASLALCGVRGGLLRELQDQIQRQQIDGQLFDKMLRSNTLTDLGIEELNPRLSLAIRRSWTTDFGSVNFVDYSSNQARPQGSHGQYVGGQQYSASVSQEQPQQEPFRDRFSQNRAPSDHPSRESYTPLDFPAREIPRRDHPSRESVPGHRPWATYEDPPPRSRGGGGPSPGGSSIGSSSVARGAPQTPAGLYGLGDGARRPPPVTPQDPYGGADPRDLFGARGSAMDDMPPHASPWGGGHSPPMVNGAGDPRAHGGAYPRQDYENHGYPDHRRLQPPRVPSSPGMPPLQGIPGAGGTMDERRSPMGNTMGSTVDSIASGMGGRSWDDGPPMSPMGQIYDGRGGPSEMSLQAKSLRCSCGNIFMEDSSFCRKCGRSRIENEDVRSDARASRQRPLSNGPSAWDGSALEEAFAPRRRPTNSYAAEASVETIRPQSRGATMLQSPTDGWGGGLDVMLPPRDRPPLNIAQPYAQAAREAERAAEVVRARAEAEALAQAEARHAEAETRATQRPPSPPAEAYEVQHRPRQAKANQVQLQAAAEWGGMSLGDALQPKRQNGNSVGGDYERRSSATANGYDRRGSGMAGIEHDRHTNDYDRRDYDDVDERPASRKAPPSRPSQTNGVLGHGSGFDDTLDLRHAGEDFNVQVKVPHRATTGGIPRSPVSSTREFDMQDAFPAAAPPPQKQRSVPATRSRQPTTSAADDGWGGQSLADAFAPKKAPPQNNAGGSTASRAPPPRGGTTSSGADCTKKPEEIIAWVRSLPESHVPEKSRENIAAIVEDERLSGNQFTEYVQRVPPEICAPKNAMKLKAAWNNVLAEAAAVEVARENARNQPTQKATMIVV